MAQPASNPIFVPSTPARSPAGTPPTGVAAACTGGGLIQLVLDDGLAEGSVGVAQGAGARQFLWFNRFASPGPSFSLEEICVLFPSDPGLAVGQAIELVVYHDPDSNPANGATHLASVAATILVADGVTFSVYPLAPVIEVPAGGDVLIGVVNRFVASGVTPLNFPAALDTTATQMRSWIVTWSGDPPAPPALPSDGSQAIIDTFPGLEGNWMIRGAGSPILPPTIEIPTASGAGLMLLVVLCGFAGVWVLRRTLT
jgi:hypothetical protein